MNDHTPRKDQPQTRAGRVLHLMNRHRIKLTLLVAALAIAFLLADAALKGSAY